MSLNPAKISGTCGRLMCCLRYEQEAYEDLMKHVPKNGAFVQTSEGYGNVVLVNCSARRSRSGWTAPASPFSIPMMWTRSSRFPAAGPSRVRSRPICWS
jgi:hypothetical protein